MRVDVNWVQSDLMDTLFLAHVHLCGLNLNSMAFLDTSIATEEESVSGWTTFLVLPGAPRIGQEGDHMHILFTIDDTPLHQKLLC